MAKIVLPEVGPGFNRNVINENFDKIEEALNDKVLFRDNPPGEPNQMENDLDINGFRLYNLPEPVLDHEAARFKDLRETIDTTTGLVQQAEDARDEAVIAKDSAEVAASDSASSAIESEASSLQSQMSAAAADLDAIAAAASAAEAQEIADNFGNRVYDTKALMDADLSPSAGVIGIVETGPGAGWYRKTGATGMPGWERLDEQPASEAELQTVARTADRTGWHVVGILTQDDPVVGSPANRIISFDVLTVTGGTALSGSRHVNPASGLVVPSGEAAYVDLDGPLDGNGRLTADVTTGGYTAGMSAGAFVTDRRVYLYINGPGTRIGGPLAQQSLIGINQVTPTLDNRTVRPAWEVLGNVEDIRRIGTDEVVTTGILSVVTGSGRTVHRINAIAGVSVPQGQALYVDLDGAVDGSGRLTAAVTTGGYATVASATPVGSFVDDRRLYLLINDASSLRGGALAEMPSRRRIANPVWYESGTLGSGGVTYNPATRTLAWTTTLTLPLGNNQRVQIAPGSIVIPSGTFQGVYLDLAEALVTSGSTTPVTALKALQYFDGTDAARAMGQDVALPLFKVQSANIWGPVNGFPNVRDATPAPPVGDTTPESDVFVVVGTDTASVYIKGSNSASRKYIEYTLIHQVNPYNPSDPYGNRDVWRIGYVYESEKSDVDLTFSRGRVILTSGEVECAILENGQGDYIGGWHGDEVLSFARLLLDGVEISLTTPATHIGKRCEYLQSATLYRCNTQTPVGTHVKRGRFTWSPDGTLLRLWQRVEWDVIMTIKAAMLTMLPIARIRDGQQVTDTAMRAPWWEEEDVSVAGFPEILTAGDLPDAQIWGSTSGISAEVRMLKYPDIPSRNFRINNSETYNKFYYSVAGRNDESELHTTTAGEIWDVESEITINTSI